VAAAAAAADAAASKPLRRAGGCPWGGGRQFTGPIWTPVCVCARARAACVRVRACACACAVCVCLCCVRVCVCTCASLAQPRTPPQEQVHCLSLLRLPPKVTESRSATKPTGTLSASVVHRQELHIYIYIYIYGYYWMILHIEPMSYIS
jgi:hypothetical protein